MAHILSDRDYGRVSRVVSRVERMPDSYTGRQSEPRLIPHEFCRFELVSDWEDAEDVATGAKIKECDACVVVWSHVEKKYIRLKQDNMEECYTFRLTDREGTFGGSVGPNELTETEIDGTTGLAWNPHDCNRWEIAAPSSSLVAFILYDDVAPGDTDKNAWPVKDDLTADTSAGKVLLQNTFPGNFRGYGDAHTGFDATTAARVLAATMPDGKLHIVGGKGMAKMCYCTAKISSGNTLSVVDNVVPMDGGHSPVASSSEELTLSASEWETDDNAGGIIVWDENSDAWRPVDFPCKTAS